TKPPAAPPPLSYGAYLGFVLTAIGGALYLWKQRAIYDQLAVAGAEVGVGFFTLMVVTGPIWGKGPWPTAHAHAAALVRLSRLSPAAQLHRGERAHRALRGALRGRRHCADPA